MDEGLDNDQEDASDSSSSTRSDQSGSSEGSESSTEGSGSSEEESSSSDEDMSDKAFRKRHRRLEKEEKKARKEKGENTLWGSCDSASCRKWRVLEEGTNLKRKEKYYCGHSSSPDPIECGKLDDWVVRCVGLSSARQLAEVNILTVDGLKEDVQLRTRLHEKGFYLDPDNLQLHPLENLTVSKP